MEPSSPEQVARLDRQMRITLRISGGILFFFGLVAALIAGGIAWDDFRQPPASPKRWEWGYWAGLASIAIFCLQVGFRLLLQRSNRYQSILTPGGWIVLGCVFVACAGLVLFDSNSKDAAGRGEGAGGALLLASVCYLRGVLIFKEAKRTRPDPLSKQL